jgi:CHRD domain
MRHLPPLFLALVVFGCGDSESSKVNAETVSLALRSDGATLAVFNTILRSENEPNGASTSESKGFAQIKVLADSTIEFTLVINNKDAETFNRAHIHKAPVGVNGGIHWLLLEAGNPVADISGQPAILRGTARPNPALVPPPNLQDLLEKPDGYYVNVHSRLFPGGATRGQLQ